MFDKKLLPKIRNCEIKRRLNQIDIENKILENRGIKMGEYEEQMALKKEQKPRDIYGKKIDKCGDCPRVRRNWKKDGNNLCTAAGFSVPNLNEMYRMCPLPLYETEIK